MPKILIDMNVSTFQEDLFALEKIEQRSLLKTLKKIKQLTWEDLYKDKGIRWELVVSNQTEDGESYYSFRFSQKYRCIAYREKNYIVLLSLHPDHDSAYLK